ncbi:unnamed protein product [Cercospora beticola]|nr:unnamed protein product [Cercospora beticola]
MPSTTTQCIHLRKCEHLITIDEASWPSLREPRTTTILHVWNLPSNRGFSCFTMSITGQWLHSHPVQERLTRHSGKQYFEALSKATRNGPVSRMPARMNFDEEGLATKEEAQLKHTEANTVMYLLWAAQPRRGYGQARSLVLYANQLKASCGRTVALLAPYYTTQSCVPADRRSQPYCLSR